MASTAPTNERAPPAADLGGGLNRRGLIVAVVLVVVLMVLVQNSIVRAPDLDYRPIDARTIAPRGRHRPAKHHSHW